MKQYQIFIASSLLTTLLLTGCGNKPQNAPNNIATPVSVVELKKGSISKLINTTGTVQPTYGASQNAEMSGFYKLQTNPRTGKPFKMGDRVSKGELIIRLEDKEYENGIAIDAKKLSLEIAEQEQSKQKALYEKGGVTMKVKAPFDGVIVDLPHYTADTRVEQGKAMVSLMAYDKMYMDINLPESSIRYVKEAQPVYITHYTIPGDTLKARVGELSPAISTETRTFKGKILIDNDQLKLRPGMFAKADIIVDRADSSIIIPKDVILSNRRRKYVYIVEKNTAKIRNLQTGLEDEYNIEILSGLNVNDNLVVKGFETLKEDAKVKIQK